MVFRAPSGVIPDKVPIQEKVPSTALSGLKMKNKELFILKIPEIKELRKVQVSKPYTPPIKNHT